MNGEGGRVGNHYGSGPTAQVKKLLPARASEQGNVIGLVSVYIYINTMAECRSGRKCIAVK